MLMKKTLIPQLLIPRIIRRDDMHKELSMIIDEKIIETLVRIVAEIPQDEGLIVIWLLIEQNFQKHEIISFEQKFESWIEMHVGGNWDVEAIPIIANDELDMERIEGDIGRLVHKLHVRYPSSYFAQIPFPSYPVVYQALFLEGVRQFQERYATIYIDVDHVHVEYTTLAVPSGTWTKQFREFIMDHDYEAALEMIKDTDETEETTVIKSLLQMMVDRLNFAFVDSIAHLNTALRYMPDEAILLETKRNLELLLDNNIKTRDLARIVELYRHIDMYLDVDDVVSLLVRFYRVREAILFYLLQHAQTVSYVEKIKNRSTIYEVFDELEEKYANGEINTYYGVYFYLKSANVAGALNVRNRSFIGHSRNKVDVDNLWSSYFGTSRTTHIKAKRRFMMDTLIMLRDLGATLDENIMDINRLLLRLSRKIVAKGKQ